MKKRTAITLLGLILITVLAGCSAREGQYGTPSAEEVTGQIGRQNAQFMDSFQAGDTARFASVYAPDGWMMPPNAEPIKGREGIKQFLLHAKEQGLNRIELSSGEIFLNSDSTAVETGSYEIYAGGNSIDSGTFMVYWVKGDTTWRMKRDIWNSDLSPPSAGQ